MSNIYTKEVLADLFPGTIPSNDDELLLRLINYAEYSHYIIDEVLGVMDDISLCKQEKLEAIETLIHKLWAIQNTDLKIL